MPSDATNQPAAKGNDLDAIVAGAVVVLDQVTSLEPYLPDLSPGDRERVDAYVGRASADAMRTPGIKGATDRPVAPD